MILIWPRRPGASEKAQFPVVVSSATLAWSSNESPLSEVEYAATAHEASKEMMMGVRIDSFV